MFTRFFHRPDVACDKRVFRRSFKSILVCPAFQTSSVRASQPSHRDSPVQTLAPFGQTPLQRRVAECTEPHSELHIHTTQTTVQTHGDMQELIRHSRTRLSPTKTHLPAARVQLLHKWERFPETKRCSPNLEQNSSLYFCQAVDDLKSSLV